MFSRIKKRFNCWTLPHRRVLLVSLQKCGTHLIHNLFDRFGFAAYSTGTNNPVHLRDFVEKKKHSYLSSHFTPGDDVQIALEEAPESMKIVFLFRDPRDALVSWFHWVHPNNQNTMHGHMRYMQKVYSHFNDKELMNIFITNDKFREQEYNVIEQFYLSRVLLFHPCVLNVRFEDLIGPKGGGDTQRQMTTIKRFTEYLSIDNIDIESIATTLFSKKSATFRKAQIGAYKNFLTPEQLSLFYELHGDILTQFGYE